jgi:cbb3-type cytochrome oxidase subunit 1
MNPLVRRYLKTGILFLGVGLCIGLVMIWQREIESTFPSRYLTSAHTHAILVGFVMMMILGVALWMFPRAAKDDTRYKPQFAEAAYWLVAVGTAVRVSGELLHVFTDAGWLRWSVLLSGLAQTIGLLLFFATMWFRVRQPAR